MELQDNGFSFIYRFIIQPVTLSSGIFLNTCLYILIYRQKRTKFLFSTKPMRFLLMTILLCDTWFLVDKLNLWIFTFSKTTSLTTINFFCQFISYLNYLFPIILESSMIAADYILISLVLKSCKHSEPSNVYNDFLNGQPTNQKISYFHEKIFLSEKLSRAKKSALLEPESSMKERKKCQILKDDKSNKNKVNFYARQSTALNENASNSKTNSEESNSIKSEKSITHQKPFVKLIENYQFNREHEYTNIFLKEKIFLILNIFVWMYLLSFIFWIKGLTDLNSKNIFKMSNLTSNEPLGICSTFVYYQRLAAILNMFLSCLKIMTVFINICSSCLFHFTFRHEYILSLKSTFRKNHQLAKLKMANFRQFYLFYSTKRNWSDYNHYKKSKNQAKNYILHYKHFHFVRHYALSTLIYSLLVMYSVFFQYRDNLNQLKDLYLNKTEFVTKRELSSNLTSFWNHQGSVIDLSFLKFGNESQSTSAIEKYIRIKKDDSFLILSEYTEYLAHSTKFIVYILFSVHFKFYVKFYKTKMIDRSIDSI